MPANRTISKVQHGYILHGYSVLMNSIAGGFYKRDNADGPNTGARRIDGVQVVYIFLLQFIRTGPTPFFMFSYL